MRSAVPGSTGATHPSDGGEAMLRDSEAFSSFSVDDTARAREFYEGMLGLDVRDGGMEGSSRSASRRGTR